MKSEESIIFPNSINRVIFVEKEEFVISYKHGRIDVQNITSEILDYVDIGKFYLSHKNKKTQFVSEDKLIAGKTINQNVLNNDKMLIKKIVNILDGSFTCNEIFKFEDKNGSKIFKIIFQMKNGVNLNIFSCDMKEVEIDSFNDVMLTCMRYFKTKSKIQTKLECDIAMTENNYEKVLKSYNTLTRDLEKEQESVLTNVRRIVTLRFVEF